jgi:hypothetical protein
MGAIECLTSVPEKWDGTTISGDDQMPRHADRQASSAAACNMITITGIGDHDRLEWLITMNGIRSWGWPRRRCMATAVKQRAKVSRFRG